MKTVPLFVIAISALGALGWPCTGVAQSLVYLGRLGLTDVQHTGPGGVQFSIASGNEFTTAGDLAGYSERGSFLGTTAWVGTLPATTVRVGLYDPEHTSTDGSQFSSIISNANASGFVSGRSERFDSGGESSGFTAWIGHRSGTTTEIGHYDAAHTDVNGYQSSIATSNLTNGGLIAGQSNRYDGGTESRGTTAWLATTGGAMATIGLYDAAHTAANGTQTSSPLSNLTESGYVAGQSQLYNGSSENLGQTAWIANTTGTASVGFSNPEHTNSSGGHFSVAITNVTEAGYVAGRSTRYNGGSDVMGQTAWIASSSGVTTAIGLVDAAHTSSGGSRVSVPVGNFTESGFVAGTSLRYGGGATAIGETAWIGTTTGSVARIGLTDAEHTRLGGGQISRVTTNMNEAGKVAGYSVRYNGGASALGQTAWLGTSTGVTTPIGFYTAQHTHSDGTRYSIASTRLTEAGYVGGYSYRYDFTSHIGQSAWVASTSKTTAVGLVDSLHTSSANVQESEVVNINEAGYAWGFSIRYNGDDGVGQTAWIMDVNTETQFALTLSVRSADQYAFTSINDVNAHGVAVGSYTLFDATGAQIGTRAFVWSAVTGALDLGSQFALGAIGWDAFTEARGINDDGVITGYGDPAGATGQGVFAVQFTTVPEPATVSLVISAGVIIYTCGRGRRAS
jgi:hypothetical protein